MLENYHTHTPRCHHAKGAEEEYIRAAIAGGLQVLGFSDHAPFIFPDGYRSRVRMLPEELEDYVQTVFALREKYAGQIDIRLGLEVEYFPDRIPALLELIKPFGIEYMILGQHWCGNGEAEPTNGTPTYSQARLKQYCDQVIEAMDTGLFSYIAHPDTLHFLGEDAIYRTHMERLCRAAREKDMPLEINLLGCATGRHYPRELFWQIAGENGCKVVIGSDAHDPTRVVDPVSEEKALAIVEKYKLTLLEHVPIHPYI